VVICISSQMQVEHKGLLRQMTNERGQSGD
jgi:hypothetical protein